MQREKTIPVMVTVATVVQVFSVLLRLEPTETRLYQPNPELAEAL